MSRELLESFTLGIGNYTEQDIKNGAKGLAGLGIDEENAVYRKIFENNEPFVYLGKKGNFKIDEMIDIIFEQPNIPYLITRKILKWFIYDNPKEELVRYYGDYFKKMDFEIQPLLTKIFTEEFAKKNAGSKIKNPLEFSLQLMDELNVANPNTKLIVFFIREARNGFVRSTECERLGRRKFLAHLANFSATKQHCRLALQREKHKSGKRQHNDEAKSESNVERKTKLEQGRKQQGNYCRTQKQVVVSNR